MAKKNKTSVHRIKAKSSKGQNDNKFYVKFKDPRSKSQIFYYFNEEDIFDPCIPLNQGDVVADSSSVKIPVTQNPKQNIPPIQAKNTAISNRKKSSISYVEEQTLQVPMSNMLPNKKTALPKQDTASINNDFEDVGYMTAMDLHFDPNEIEELEEEQEEEEVVLQTLEEIPSPLVKNNKKEKILQIHTAIEALDNQGVLIPIKLTKEEFEKKSGKQNCPDYKIWTENHLSKQPIPAREISPAEFRLLKKLIGLKRI